MLCFEDPMGHHLVGHPLSIISAKHGKTTKLLDSRIERKVPEIKIFELIWVIRTSSHFMGIRVMFKKIQQDSHRSTL